MIKNKRIFLLLLKVLFIYLLLYMGDFLFSLYNTNYPPANILHLNLGLYLAILSILLFKAFWLRVLLLSGILTSMLIEYCYYQYFGTFVQPIGFYQILLNTHETYTVFADEASSMIVPLLIFLGLLFSIVLLKNMMKIDSLRNNKLALLFLTLLFLNSLYTTHYRLHSSSGKLRHKNAKRIMPLPKIHSSENYLRALKYFLIGILPQKILSEDINKFPKLPQLNEKLEQEENNVIFIIGESLRAKQLGILGYELQTTPNLANIDGLYSKSIYSSGTMTKVSVSSLLNRVKYPGSTAQIMQQTNNLFNLAKQHHYKTFFYSWQKDSELTILQNFIGRKFIDNYASREGVSQKVHTLDGYDDNLFHILKSIHLDEGNNFIVLHQRGSHAVYEDNYPKSFDKFEKPYDNTVLYADFLLNEIIQYLKKISKKPTYIVYTSDHGELLHEHGKNGHGWFFPEVYKVPFLFYGVNTDINSSDLKNIQNHFDVSNLIASFLGYKVTIKNDEEIYVNGSDVDALAGYLHIQLDENGTEVHIDKIQ